MLEKKVKARVNVTMSQELLDKIDKKCEEMGVNRSSFISNKIADVLAKEDLAFDTMVQAAKEVMLKSVEEKK